MAALQHGDSGWVLLDAEGGGTLGRALAWSRRAGVRRLRILADADAGIVARRSRAFADPPEVLAVRGRIVRPAEPEPFPGTVPPPEGISDFVAMIEVAGAEPVIEAGVLRAEVLGLEVARVVDTDDGPVMEVGVGRHDRAAHRALHAEADLASSLADAATTVRRYRRPGVASHPANVLCPERWLRAVVIADPPLVGASRLGSFSAASGSRQPDLWERAPAAALGLDGDGSSVLVVCSTGVDLDLVPLAGDLFAAATELGASGPPSSLVLALPDGDDVPLTRELASSLTRPAEVRVVRRDWKWALAPSR